MLVWEHINALVAMQRALLNKLYPNRHNPEHADHAACTYILMLEQQMQAYQDKLAANYVVHDDSD